MRAAVLFASRCLGCVAGLVVRSRDPELGCRCMCASDADDKILFGLHAPDRGITASKMDPIRALLKPAQDDNGRWIFNPALSTLNLICAATDRPILPSSPWMIRICGNGCIALIPQRLFALSAIADNDIRDAGAEALGAALAPKQNPDGTWSPSTQL